jgi:hypothetical protein
VTCCATRFEGPREGLTCVLRGVRVWQLSEPSADKVRQVLTQEGQTRLYEEHEQSLRQRYGRFYCVAGEIDSTDGSGCGDSGAWQTVSIVCVVIVAVEVLLTIYFCCVARAQGRALINKVVVKV